MGRFKFQIVQVVDAEPKEWLRVWAARYDLYPDPHDEPVYRELMEKYKSFSPDDFEQIGRWKDNAWTPGKWKEDVAQVAYMVWKKAAKENPRCPEESGVEKFLADWSGESYTDHFPKKSVNKHFGLSRATTLLHFISGGCFPILDGRVRKALARLSGSTPPEGVAWYLNSFRGIFLDLAAQCEAEELRTLDKALFAYGASSELDALEDEQKKNRKPTTSAAPNYRVLLCSKCKQKHIYEADASAATAT